MRLNVCKITDNRRLVLGKVKEMNPGKGSLEGKCINIVLEGTEYDKEKKEEVTKNITISFFNNDKVNMMDRLINAGVSEGSILTVEVYENDKGYLSANNFKYKGHWTFPATEDRKEINVFMGTVASVNIGEASNGHKYLRISMPDEKRKDEETNWVDITFWNDDNNNLADRAIKWMVKDDAVNVIDDKKIKIVARCGERREYNGKDQYQGYDFIVMA